MRLYKEDDIDLNLLPPKDPFKYGKFRIASSPEEAHNLCILYGLSSKEYIQRCEEELSRRQEAKEAALKRRTTGIYPRSPLWDDSTFVFEIECPMCEKPQRISSQHNIKTAIASMPNNCKCGYSGIFKLTKSFQ